jgi:hypothetical protein
MSISPVKSAGRRLPTSQYGGKFNVLYIVPEYLNFGVY